MIEHIYGGVKLALGNFRLQGTGGHKSRARRVYEQSARLHLCKILGGDQTAGLGFQSDMQADNIGLFKKGLARNGHSFPSRSGPRAPASEPHHCTLSPIALA